MSNLEKLPEFNDETFRHKYNTISKRIIRTVGANLTSFVCMLIPVVLIGLIWTDFTAHIFTPAVWTDGAVTVVMFIVGEMMAMRLGSEGGKLDKEYITAKCEFEALIEKVNTIGTLLLGVFCEWQIDVELEQAFQYHLRTMRMTAEDYEAVKDLPYPELKKKFGKKKARAIVYLSHIEPVELNEAILLYDGSKTLRGGVPISPDQYLMKKSHLIEVLFACAFTGLLTVAIMPVMTEDVSLARIIYTVFKVSMLFVRMVEGYGRGARAFNTIAVRQYKAKSTYLRQYIRFMGDKTYLKLGDQYGDISCFVNE